jgi:signal transduction histidine kinase
MIGEIKRRDDEIRRFNEELQQRVEERTAELRAAQDQILRTRRLAAIGSLGAGVAHELNNPLTSVIGLATALKRELGKGDSKSQALDLLIEQAGRAARIVNDLRQFTAQEQEAGGGQFAAEEPVKAALACFEDQLEAQKITLVRDFAQDLPPLQGAPMQIQQLVAHLLQNAINAMPNGGELRVGIGGVEGEASKISVSDTGKGIPKELRERIFDPFFSTKDLPSQGGMGLALCHGIAEAHHGRITVESEVGKGSTFTVLLPAAPPRAHLA